MPNNRKPQDYPKKKPDAKQAQEAKKASCKGKAKGGKKGC